MTVRSEECSDSLTLQSCHALAQRCEVWTTGAGVGETSIDFPEQCASVGDHAKRTLPGFECARCPACGRSDGLEQVAHVAYALELHAQRVQAGGIGISRDAAGGQGQCPVRGVVSGFRACERAPPCAPGRR